MSANKQSTPPRRRRGPGRLAANALAGMAAVGIALACGAGSAQADTGFGAVGAIRSAAASGAGLRVAVSGSEAAPKLTLTNGSSAPCQVPDATLGAVVFDQVQQDGKPVQPVIGDAWFDDSVPDYLTTTLRTLAPGQSLQVPLPVVSPRATGPALEAVDWADADSSTGALYPLKTGQATQITLTYTPPLVSSGTVPLCQADSASASATLTASTAFTSAAPGSSPRKIAGIPLPTLIYAGAGVLVLLLIAVFVFFRARRRRRRAVTQTVVILALLAAGLAHSTASAPPASAKVTVTSPILNNVYAKCLAVLQSPGGDPSHILGDVLGPNSNVEVQYAAGDENHEDILPGGKIIIFWDPTDQHAYVGGGNADACSTLYHEMDHAYQDLNGGQNTANCWTVGPDGKLHDSGIKSNEVQATREQNMLRHNQGLTERKTYDDKILPPGKCQPPPNKPAGGPKVSCAGLGCGDTNGDPHLTTFEGVRYNFQGAGEFVATDDPRGGFQIQVRQQPFPGRPDIAVNTAIALDVADDRVQIGMTSQGLLLLVDGVTQTSTTMALTHGGSVETGYGTGGETMTVTWPDKSTATITQISVWGLHLTVRPSAAHTGDLKGLLGNLGGDASTSIQTATGARISSPSFSTLYPGFADSWRITDATSLFTYTPGTSTATYTDKSFPHAPVTLTSVPDLATATSRCTGAGITDPTTLQDCELDVGLTGESAFADADAQSQPPQSPLPPAQNGGVFGIDGASATVNLPAINSSATLHFTGTAGQIVFVDVPTSTLPNACDAVELKAPDGSRLNSGCIVNGAGYIPASKLPADGTYTVLVGPASSGPGSATVRLIQDVDQTGTITPDGPPVTATVSQPGATSALTFDAAPGTTVFVQVLSSTLPGQCGVPDLIGPDNSTVTEGCTVNGEAYIPATTLVASGTYTILVSPEGADTGTVTLKVIVDHDQTAPITVDGPPVTSAISRPGEVSRLTFQGTARQTVTVHVTGSTLPGDCGNLAIQDAKGDQVATGCILNGAGSTEPTRLATTGQYTILINPGYLSTGTSIVRLTSR